VKCSTACRSDADLRRFPEAGLICDPKRMVTEISESCVW
jgi:hypothetical protein